MREESNKKQLWETGALFFNESNKKRMWKAGILSPNGCSVRNIDEKALEDAAEESLEKGFHSIALSTPSARKNTLVCEECFGIGIRSCVWEVLIKSNSQVVGGWENLT